jgi:hypothetical protein
MSSSLPRCSSSSTAAPTRTSAPRTLSWRSKSSASTDTSANRMLPCSPTAYRFMRVVEHRVQIPRMMRNALIPDDDAKLRMLARSVFRSGSRTGARLEETRRDYARHVTRLHEQIFYRPILEAAVGVHGAVVEAHKRGSSLQAAADRLRAFGYRDPQGALGHIKALTTGVSRTAMVIKQVLPALLDWFSDGVEPDRALLGVPATERIACLFRLVPQDAQGFRTRRQVGRRCAVPVRLRHRAAAAPARGGGLVGQVRQSRCP